MGGGFGRGRVGVGVGVGVGWGEGGLGCIYCVVVDRSFGMVTKI